MKKIAILVFLLCAAGFSVSQGEPNPPLAHKPLVAAIPTDSPPTYYKDPKTGEAAGFAVDVMNAIGKNTGHSITYIFKKDWNEIIEAVKEGTADVAPDMGITEERLKVLSFTLSTDAFPVSVFVRTGSNFAGLEGAMRAGAIKGSAAFEMISKQYPKIRLVTYDSFQNGLLDLLAGQIDAFCCPAPTLLTLARNAGIEDRIKAVGAPLLEMKRAVAVRQDNAGLLAELNGAIEAFVRTPQYKQIYHTWYGVPTPYWTAQRISIWSGVLIVLIIISMAMWRYYTIHELNHKLTVSAENFRTLFNKSADSIFLVRPDGSIADVNEMVCKRYKYRKEELLKMTVSQIDSPATRVLAKERTAKVVKDGMVIFEVEHVAKDGECFPVEANASSVILNGEPLLISTCRDITERKKAEEALLDEKERLAVTLRSIGDGVIVTDIHGDVVLLNKVGEHLTGWLLDEAKGRPLTDVFNIINESTREKCENPVEKVLKTGMIVGLANHTALIRKDGSEIIIADSAAPIRDSRSETIGIVLVFRDVTAQYRMEQEMQKIQKLESLGLLAGGLAHDFNNLLTSILGNVSLVKMQLGVDHKSFARLTDAEKAARRAADLTQQLLTFAKGGAPIKTPASIAEIARETCQFAMSGSNAQCLFTIPAALWGVEVDKGQMSQVFNNLIINAMHAMPDGGAVHIGFENVSLQENQVAALRPGDYVRVTFRDEGAGIPDNNLTKIFEPYYTTKAGGSGLGLATVLSIINRHEGHIAVASKVGEGSVFTLYVPAIRDTVLPDTFSTCGVRTGHGKILIMDDEELVRNIAGDILRELGYTVEFAKDGKEAINVYLKAGQDGKPFDVVIMDLTIPGGMGGKEAVKHLKAISPEAKVIVSSGYSMDPIMAEYEKYGFSGVVCKPYNANEISEAITKVQSEREKGA